MSAEQVGATNDLADIDPMVARQPAVGKRYVGLSVVPRRRRAIERALGRVVQLGGEALLITADGSSKARWPGVDHLDLLDDEMRFGPNRLVAVSPKRVVGKLVGKKVGGRSLLWQHWSASRPYKAVRYYALWHILRRRLDRVRVDDVTDLLLAGIESWPIAWHLVKENPDLSMGWDVPEEWQRPAELEPLGGRRVAVWGANPSWNIFSQGGDHRAEAVWTFAASSWIAQATPGALVGDLVPDGDSFEERVVREDLNSRLISGIVEMDPQIVVLDALGELSEIVHVGEWCTLSEFTADLGLDAPLRERADDSLTWSSPRRFELFERAARRVSEMLVEGLPQATFVLHRVQLPTGRTGRGDLDGNHPETDLAAVNRLLDRYHTVITEAFGDRLKVIDVEPDLRRPAPRSQTAKGIVQAGFASAYYEEALGKLDEVTRDPS